MRTKFWAVVAVVVMIAGLGTQPASAQRAPHLRPVQRVCARAHGLRATCSAQVISRDGVTPLATVTPDPTALTPADLASAYNYSLIPGVGPGWGTGRTIAIVDAMDNPNAEADLGAYRAQFGLSPCTTANGCFKKVNQNGAASPLPAGNVSWGEEIDLDIEMASAVCPDCKILLVEANSSIILDLIAAEARAVALGASAVSNSWGSSAELGSLGPALFDRFVNYPGVAITAATGDNGYSGSWPSDVPTVIGVGGTSLTRAANARGWTETAWANGGSFCSAVDAQPRWQSIAILIAAAFAQTSQCPRRSTSDVSAVADPQTGVAVYDSYGSTGGANWFVFGGTSVSAPLVASMYARAGDLVGQPSTMPYPASGTYVAWYKNTKVLNDVTTGSNGNGFGVGCPLSYECNAQLGYDGPTGLGTPNGFAAF
ncbi:MAG TPA: S53 family peptidase [Acidimicrobiia bacterium]|nr:S53 family peptidase [Acidimicrobiia bacterium]